MRVAINGFGRIGRAMLRSIFDRRLENEVEVVAINDLTEPETLAHLLRNDTVYGKFDRETTIQRYSDTEIQRDKGKATLAIDGREIVILGEKDPANLPWSEMGAEIVVESTGFFTDRAGAAKHLESGAKKVIVSANSKDADTNIVLGVNEGDYDADRHDVISNCSCTTNCAAPVVKILNDSLGISSAHMITIHAVTSTQNLVDGPSKNLRRSRAAFASIIPQPTGAAVAVTRVIPELEGRLSGMAFRVPVLSSSSLEVVARVEKKTTLEEVNQLFREAAGGAYEKIIRADDSDSLVSADITGTTYSSTVDLPLTEVLDGNLVKVVAWYDNEYAYACRLVDLTQLVGEVAD